MKIIYNKYIPAKQFLAINLCGIIFMRHGDKLDKTAMNHEYIHTQQQREMLIIFFYLWYVIEYLMRLIRMRDSIKAYRNISFEREAYANEHNFNYKIQRRHFAWFKYMNKQS